MRKFKSPIVKKDCEKISDSYGIDEERADFLQFKMNKLLKNREEYGIEKHTDLVDYIEKMNLSYQEGMYCFMIVTMLITTIKAENDVMEEITDKLKGGLDKIKSKVEELGAMSELEKKLKDFKNNKDSDSVIN